MPSRGVDGVGILAVSIIYRHLSRRRNRATRGNIEGKWGVKVPKRPQPDNTVSEDSNVLPLKIPNQPHYWNKKSEVVAMTGTYENFGVHFLYPENWVVADEQAINSPFEVSLQSPGGGFWMLRVYETLQDPDVLLEEVLQSMQSEYEGIEFEPFSESLDGIEFQGYEMNFYYLDLVATTKAYCFSVQHRTFLVHAQAETKDFEESEPVFRAMMLSLLRSAESSDA
jgi:hypothetical protein